MNSKRQLIILSLALGYMISDAQSPETVTQQSIIDHIRFSGRHELIMSDNVRDLLMPSAVEAVPERRATSMRTFWRVQVFSDNKGERSRQEGQQKRSAVARRFPDYPIELKWDSPYWQLRVGKFQTREDAEAAASRIKAVFPAYAREIHVVRQRMKDSADN